MSVCQNDAGMTEEERKEWKTKPLEGFDAEFTKIDTDLAPLYNLTLVNKKKKNKSCAQNEKCTKKIGKVLICISLLCTGGQLS